MSMPGNGIYVVRGEMSTLMTAMRRGSRWNSTFILDDEKEPLLKLFVDLKLILDRTEDLRLIEPNDFLSPFLEVIRTDETTGAVTSLALVSINKFLSYGLIDPTSATLGATVENIVDAVTHARFMGTDQSSDGVTLFRVVQVLHTLMRSPEGSALSNEAVCEVMLSCFKICFEPRLNELLRRSAEQALKDMVLLLFMRLPQFSEHNGGSGLLRKFQLMAASIEQNKKQHNRSTTNMPPQHNCSQNEETINHGEEEDARLPTAPAAASEMHCSPNSSLGITHLKVAPLATTPATPAGNILDMQGKISQTPPTSALATGTADATESRISSDVQPDSTTKSAVTPKAGVPAVSPVDDFEEPRLETASVDGSTEYINSVGVRFTQQISGEGAEVLASLLPYGLPCVQELFRFLIMLCNPVDKQNTDTMIHMGLSLLTVAFEVGADNIGKYETLLELVRDDLCRNLIALMSSERLTLFAANLQLCFLLFESLRGHLKFQLEAFIKKLAEIIVSDYPKTPYEMRELVLDNLLQLFRIPGFVAELYINYDCDLYCSDVLENVTKLLSKYTLSATNAVYGTHIIAMDALISVISSIEQHCVVAKDSAGSNGSIALTATSNFRHSRHNSGLESIVIDSASTSTENKCVIENISKFLSNTSSRMRISHSVGCSSIPREKLAELKQKKRLLSQGTDLFNQRPDKGIQYLQENSILNNPLDPMEVALFLRKNPGLDKKMIGEYISKKKNVDSKILMNFVESFNFAGLRVDQALRLYLETFRLPGEAPLIFLVLEHFADHWHKQNGEPFANTDAAFSLAYAIIMLNMDQHNSNAKRLNVPMTSEDFLKNLRGLNGGADFDQDMLCTIFSAIKNEEIVMPAEQTGLVRENYLWKVLLRRGATSDGVFNYVEDSAYDLDIFQIIWGALLSALSFMFDRSSDNGYQRTLAGFTKSAAISAHYNLHGNFDALILTLCKFTTLLNTVQSDIATSPAHNDIVQAVNFGSNAKAQAALKTVFALVHEYGDCLREGWKSILDVQLQLFRLKLLPKSLMEVEDFCEPSGKAQLIVEKPTQKQEAGLFSSLYSYLSSEGQREPSHEEQELIKAAKKSIKECQLDQMIQELKFVQLESLQELLKIILASLKAPTEHKSVGLPYAEDVVVFWMEFLIKVVIHNRDRMIPLWPRVRDQMYLLLMSSASCGYEYLLNRSIVAVLKLAVYLMRNEELCPTVLQSLKMLLMLKRTIILSISKQISIGVYELLKTSAQNIHSEQDWQIIFTILECAGAGAVPPHFQDTALSTHPCAMSFGALSGEKNSDLPNRGYISDPELTVKQQQQQLSQVQPNNGNPCIPSSPTTENWILINKDTDDSNLSRPQSPPVCPPQAAPTLAYNCLLAEHSPFALFKCWDSLAFIVRNVAHITPYNFESCVRCIRTFVEACRDGGIRQHRKFESGSKAPHSKKKSVAVKHSERDTQNKTSIHALPSVQCDIEAEDLAQRYETVSIQLLDLMYTLYTRTAQIFRWWAEEDCAVPQCSALWAQGWCPLLQGIARLATDRRREVRTYAISCLQQRALLVHDLQTLSGAEWASCFKQVLFPLLNELLPESPSVAYLDIVLLEESRIRTATIMSKVFLHHLTPLIKLGPLFSELWVEVLDYIDKFMKVGSDMLSEQMQEILKNMLLVMHSVRVFHSSDGTLDLPLWQLTWKRIGQFLPNLKEELFRDEDNKTQELPTTIEAAMKKCSEESVPSRHQPIVTEVSSVRTPNISPIDSPRHSIILNPPLTDEFQGQVPLRQPMPVLVPQGQLTQKQQHSTTSPILPAFGSYNQVLMQSSSNLMQPVPILAAPANMATAEANGTSLLPDLISDTSRATSHRLTSAISPEKIATSTVQASKSHSEFPASTLSVANANASSYTQSEVSTELPTTLPTYVYTTDNQRHGASLAHCEKEELQQLNQPLYQQCQQQQTAHVEQQLTSRQVQHGFVYETTEFSSSTGTETLPAAVPIGHLLAGSRYTSLPKIPKPSIEHSFAPVYVPQAQSQQNDADIYQEYVQNPYNHTLQQPAAQQMTASEQLQPTQQMASPASFYRSVDPKAIPSGSEMLYGQF